MGELHSFVYISMEFADVGGAELLAGNVLHSTRITTRNLTNISIVYNNKRT
jgi:hypothetical protein